MYVVRDKKSKKVIHINPAPLVQALEGKDIYFEFDAKKMEIGRSDVPLPEHFDISKDGEIIALGIEEKVKAGLIELEPHQKAVNGEIVEKTLAEKVADGLIELEPDQKVDGDQIVAKTTAEMLEEGLISLDEIKQQKKAYFSALALQKRNEILPDYKIQNALMGIYDDEIAAAYKKNIEAFRKQYHRLEEMIDGAKSLDELNKIKARFPKSLAGSSSKTHASTSSGSSKVKPGTARKKTTRINKFIK